MTDKEFIEYLFEELRYGDDDICKKCICNSKDKLCESAEKGFINSICVEGVRKYAEANKK